MATRHNRAYAISPRALTPDGKYVYATMFSANSGDVLLVDVDTGKLVGRWALDDRLDAGLVSGPMLLPVGADRVLLGRDQGVVGTQLPGEAPLGRLNDVGLFAFPST